MPAHVLENQEDSRTRHPRMFLLFFFLEARKQNKEKMHKAMAVRVTLYDRETWAKKYKNSN